MSRKILSLGLGVQSVAMYLLSSRGEIPRCELAVFVDTGAEKAGTMRYLEFLLEWQKRNDGIPIEVVRDKNLYEDLLNNVNSTGQRFSSIPAFTMNEDGTKGMLRRQCTNEYKIELVDRAIRRHLETARIKESVELYMGISMDEWDRMANPERRWKTNVFPFCGYKMTRDDAVKIEGKTMTRTDILNWYEREGYPIPPKSSCFMCPYQTDRGWLEMKQTEPEDFAAAVRVDEAIRDSTKKGIKSKIYLHESLKPLKDVEFETTQLDMFRGDCSGYCHT